MKAKQIYFLTLFIMFRYSASCFVHFVHNIDRNKDSKCSHIVYTIYDSLFKMFFVLIFMVFNTEVASNIDDNKAQFSSEDWTFWGIRASGMHTCRTILKKNNHINK